ncbi:MAG: hypothetical protein JST11_07195 [Acidobacteria bacterium]|nr:hypothetical protein [Acidobacteriota bacterium]
MDTFKKRQKEMMRQERQREKEARRRAKIRVPLSEQPLASPENELEEMAESAGPDSPDGGQPLTSE